jgi:RHS repeat-associated protein
VDDIITWIFEEDSFAPTAKIKGNKKYSIVTDHLGTPTQGYNETGNVIWDRELDSYGRVRMLKGEEGFCDYMYQGQNFDWETGLCYNRFRYYDNEIGSYVSHDPIGLDSGELGFYNYVCDPNSWIDELGLVRGGTYHGVRSTNTGGQVHHMPANSVNGLGYGSGPSIWMTKADHAHTGSHGSQGLAGKAYRDQQAQHIANGRFDKAMLMDIRDIKSKTKAGTIKRDYSASMILAVKKAKDKGLITDAQAKRLSKACI